MTISIDIKKAFKETKYALIGKNFQKKLGLAGSFLLLMK